MGESMLNVEIRKKKKRRKSSRKVGKFTECLGDPSDCRLASSRLLLLR